MGRADLVACRQIGQGQRHIHVVRHQVQHPGVKAAHGVAQQAAQVELAPIGLQKPVQFGGPSQINILTLKGFWMILVIQRKACGSLKFVFSGF
jgi:hypothetical protein